MTSKVTPLAARRTPARRQLRTAGRQRLVDLLAWIPPPGKEPWTQRRIAEVLNAPGGEADLASEYRRIVTQQLVSSWIAGTARPCLDLSERIERRLGIRMREWCVKANTNRVGERGATVRDNPEEPADDVA